MAVSNNQLSIKDNLAASVISNSKSINNRATTAMGQLTETHADLAAKRCPAAEVEKNNLMKINNKSMINNATSAMGQLGITKAISGEANKKSTTNVASSEAVIAQIKNNNNI